MITMMWWGYSGMSGWGYALMGVSTVLFWGLLAAVIVLATRYVSRGVRTGASAPTPEELLAQRFARGEIGSEDYYAGLEVLRARHDHPIGR
ncbi:hypothetical protein AB0H88_51960 [Nonomuraea sp. NPDC050680]|uniref:SHOCT domain-containing protein n=1 Tax=Nonomuraea sp. NPDC050680 TaxID=3154630 RepID=UPI0033C12920